MAERERTSRICANGHQYSKSSDCPVCPVCEKNHIAKGFLSAFSGPARRALEHNNIFSVADLANFTKKEVLAFHGIGKASLPAMERALDMEGLSFKG